MLNPLTRKLLAFCDFTTAERRALARLGEYGVQRLSGDGLGNDLGKPGDVYLLVDGWAQRYKILPDGGRQILAYLLPGDMSERDTDVFGGFDHEMEAIGHATVCQISKQTLLETERDHPRIAIALAWAACVERATLQEWIANLGRRSPERRVAHLLCELWKRMAIIGNADGDVMSFPVSQVQLADTVGLTPVTVNRIIQRLRQQNIIILQNGKLQVVQAEQLCTMAGFDAAYLYADNYQAKSHDS